VQRILITTLAAGAVAGLCATQALADSTPIGALPKGPVSTIATHKGLLVAVALPHQAASTGLVWRIARPVDTAVIRQVSEADVGKNVVVVFRVMGKGQASVVFALTRGDSSSKAVRAVTSKIRVR
jgi:hypothetical protein